MQKSLLIAAAALLVSVTGAYATSPVVMQGTYSLSYSATNGASTDMSFSSTPGDGAVAGPDLGAGMSGQSVSSTSFSESLTVGTADTVNFFTAVPSGSCSGCSGSTATGTITATFTFVDPSGATGNFTDTATYSANYSGTLACAGSANPADCVVWSTSNDPITVNFTDGAVMTIALNNAEDWAITPTVTFDMTKGPTAAPEPASLALFGTALLHAAVACPPPAPDADPSIHYVVPAGATQFDKTKFAISVNAGTNFAIALDSNPTTGYSWQQQLPEFISGTAVQYLGCQWVRSDTPGQPGVELWAFRAANPGSSTVQVVYTQPWRRRDDAPLHSVAVTVSPGEL